MPLRVLFITPLFPPHVGGASSYADVLSKHLIKSPAIEQITVWTEQHPGLPAKDSILRGKILAIRSIPRRISLSYRSRLSDILRYIQVQIFFFVQLNQVINTHNIDLIHYHARYRGFIFHCALRKSGVPIIADLRDKLTNPKGLEAFAHALITCTENTYAHAVDSGFPRKKVHLIPTPFAAPEPLNTTNKLRFHELNGIPEGPYILFAGDISIGKGVPELIGAFKELHSRKPQYSLVLVGRNRIHHKNKGELMETSGSIWLPPVPQPVLFTLIKNAEIIVLPSRSEAISRFILEALYFKKKVLAPPNVPEYEKYIPAFVLKEITPNEILEKMEQLLETPEKPQYPLEHHDADYVANLTIQLYQSIMDLSDRSTLMIL